MCDYQVISPKGRFGVSPKNWPALCCITNNFAQISVSVKPIFFVPHCYITDITDLGGESFTLPTIKLSTIKLPTVKLPTGSNYRQSNYRQKKINKENIFISFILFNSINDI
jgi:hypothetical protein